MDFSTLKFETWLIVVLAALAGAVLTQLFNALTLWYRQPALRLAFSKNEAGCLVDAPARFTINGKSVVGVQRCLRIKVKNTGRSIARSVNVCVTEIIFYDLSSQGRVFAEEVLDLPLALSRRAVFELAPGGHRFIDLFFVDDPGTGPALRFPFNPMPDRLALQGFGPGSYSAAIFATAENASSCRRRLFWHWDGTVPGLVIA
jgi:hypothetical protein